MNLFCYSISTYESYLIEYAIGWGWRDGSLVKSACCSYRAPGLESQHLHPLISSVIYKGISKGIQRPLLTTMSITHECGIQIHMQVKHSHT